MTDGQTTLTPQHHIWRWKILIATYMAYAGYYLTRKVFTICKTSIATDLGWELGDTAHIWTAFLVAYMIGQFVCSFLGRKLGARVLLLGGLGISIVCNTIFGFSNSYATFLVFMFFNGLLQASGWPGSVGAISMWLRDKERGTIMGFWSTSYLVGNMMVKSLGGFLLALKWDLWGYHFGGWQLVVLGLFAGRIRDLVARLFLATQQAGRCRSFSDRGGWGLGREGGASLSRGSNYLLTVYDDCIQPGHHRHGNELFLHQVSQIRTGFLASRIPQCPGYGS